MATGWNGNEKGIPKEPRKVLGGRRKPGGVVVARKPEADVQQKKR
jgi:hypothetical protein